MKKTLLIVGFFGILLWLERRRPLRRTVDSPFGRAVRNAGLLAVNAGVLRLTQQPVLNRLVPAVERHRGGLLNRLPLRPGMRNWAGVLLLDYTLYLWHILTHRLSWLWRFHIVHHSDLDLDASTALRFHVGEMILSIGWRVGQIALLGIPPRALAVWQTAFPLSIVFHHSNLRLPIGLERKLNGFIATPRLHGIHHSVVERESNSNWTSGLTLWDRLHGTLRPDVPQEAITIGVPAYRAPQELTFIRLLEMPFIGPPQEVT